MIDIWDVVKLVIPLAVTVFIGWRIQLIGKRRFEVAETSLVDFSLALGALSAVRNPFSGGDEGQDRPNRENDADAIRRLKDSYWVPIERLNKRADVFAPLTKDRMLCKYIFGDYAEEPFEELRQIYNEIQIASSSLVRRARERPIGDQVREQREIDRITELEEVIWGSYDAEDRIHLRLQSAQKKLEAILRPALKQYGEFFPTRENLQSWGRALILRKIS
jgi:hypothetical protein